MVWVITTKTDNDFYVSDRNKNFLTEILGEENVSFTDVDEEDNLSFVKDTDVVLCQTRNLSVIEKIRKTGAKNTCESLFTILYTKNKRAVKDYVLRKEKIPYPYTIEVENIKESDFPVFVKPAFGEDSNGVDEKSICYTKEEVGKKVKDLEEEGFCPIIEKFIDGHDITVAILQKGNREIEVYPVMINLKTENNIMTHNAKMSEDEVCYPFYNDNLIACAKKAFKALGCRHYMRIDFRMDRKGNLFLIDFNLFPGLGPTDHFCKCLSLCGNLSYRNSISLILESASKI